MKSLIKKVFLLLLPGLHLAGGAFAQQQQESFTLEECIEYAIQNNVNVKNEALNRQIAQAQVGETLSQGLPQISASGEFTYNVAVPTSFIPARFQDPTAPEDLYFPVRFGIPYQANGSVRLTQLLFDGSYFVGLQAAKVYKSLAEKGQKRAEIDVAEGVSLAYYGALVAEARSNLLNANIQRLDSLYRETKAMNEQGFAEIIDVQRVKVNLNNVRTEFDNVQRSLGINLSMLKFQMGVPQSTPITLTQSIDDFSLSEDYTNPDNFSYAQRIEYQQLQVNEELASLEIRNNQAQYLPRLSAFANFGYNAGRAEFKGLFRETPDIVNRNPDTGETTIIDANTWNEFASVGLNLTVPIFDGMLKANRIKRGRLERQQVQNQLVNLGNSIDLEIERARVEMQNSIQSLASQRENMELAQEVYRVSKIKYQEGVGSNLEVIEAENAFKTAETNYFNSLYNALVARVSYRKATGSLLNNNNN